MNDQESEELRIRELHRTNPVRAVPSDTVAAEDAVQMLQIVSEYRRAREAKGLSIEQLAALANVDSGVLARFEAGRSFNPNVSVLFRLARALEMRVGWTLGSAKECA